MFGVPLLTSCMLYEFL